jgi:hypothetical protein
MTLKYSGKSFRRVAWRVKAFSSWKYPRLVSWTYAASRT